MKEFQAIERMKALSFVCSCSATLTPAPEEIERRSKKLILHQSYFYTTLTSIL